MPNKFQTETYSSINLYMKTNEGQLNKSSDNIVSIGNKREKSDVIF